MKNNQSHSKVIGSYVSGAFQCIAGSALMLIFGIFLILNIAVPLHSDQTMVAVFTILSILGILLIWRGARTCILSNHCQRIQGIMAGKSREKLSLISQIIKADLSRTVRELRMLSAKGYFKGGYVDLYRRDFVFNSSGPLPAFTPGPTVLREVEKSSVLPVYLLGGVWMFYAMLFPLYRWYHFIIAAFISIVIFFVSRRLIPHHIDIVEEKRKVEPPPKPEAINTGDPELDKVLTAAVEYMNQLSKLSLSITNERVTGPIQELLHICKQMFEYIKKTPDKVKQTRQFVNYYLPTTIKLLKNYEELSNEPVKGDNIKSAMQKIEDTMQSILTAFQKELDNLYQDKAMDISVDIEVMQNLMEQEGFSGEILKKDNK